MLQNFEILFLMGAKGEMNLTKNWICIWGNVESTELKLGGVVGRGVGGRANDPYRYEREVVRWDRQAWTNYNLHFVGMGVRGKSLEAFTWFVMLNEKGQRKLCIK